MTFNFDLIYYTDIFTKIFLACVLAGFIGYEREAVQRPAGFRTHILVCVGATIAMITNIELVRLFSDVASVSPGRLGASVISGIGFLGAGTIIRQGASVKGLTTAASLWTVACLGLVIGTGLYAIAVISTIVILITLSTFSRIEQKIGPGKNLLTISINTIDMPGQIGKIGGALGDLDTKIKSIKVLANTDSDTINLKISVLLPKKITSDNILLSLGSISDVNKVFVL